MAAAVLVADAREHQPFRLEDRLEGLLGELLRVRGESPSKPLLVSIVAGVAKVVAVTQGPPRIRGRTRRHDVKTPQPVSIVRGWPFDCLGGSGYGVGRMSASCSG